MKNSTRGDGSKVEGRIGATFGKWKISVEWPLKENTRRISQLCALLPIFFRFGVGGFLAGAIIGVFGQSASFTTMAGMAGSSGSSDGVATDARFNVPSGISVDDSGNVFVADLGNHTIRKITPSGVVTTYAGSVGASGFADGVAGGARFAQPCGIAVDNARNVFVAEASNGVIRKIDPTGTVSTLAGLPGSTGSRDGSGSNARFSSPAALAVDNRGNVYVADTGNHTIRKVTSDGVVSTIAGLAGNPGSADGLGSVARFNYPNGITVAATGEVYIADTFNSVIRKISASGVVSTFAGLAGGLGTVDGTGNLARFMRPSSVAVDGGGNVFVGDLGTVRKIDRTGAVVTLAGMPRTLGSADGTGSDARFNSPRAIAVGRDGTRYVADNGNHNIRTNLPSVPQFQILPQSLTVAAGNNAIFSVSARGNPLPTYRWQRRTAGAVTWVNLSDTEDYSGTASGTLTVIRAPLVSRNSYSFG